MFRRQVSQIVAGVLGAGVLLGLAACGGPSAAAPAPSDPVTIPSVVASSTPGTSDPSGSPSTSPSADPAACPFPQSGFSCDFQQRFAAVEAYIKTRPGTVGVVVRDRQTGAVWRNEFADTRVWTESTIKLAMAVNLFLRDQSGQITLSSSDRDLIQRMLHSSDDNAADTLWFKYAGADHMAFNNAFPTYGMTSLQPESGYTKFYPYWGFQKCTPNDLDRLINYVLTKLPGSIRDYIVGQLQNVDPDQQWGVWAAGPAAQPGNKDGWGPEDSGWMMNTVGFVGPNQRYTLAVMNALNGHGGYADGQATVSQVAKLMFTGANLS